MRFRKAFAAVHPIQSRDRVARFLLGAGRKALHNGGNLQIELTPLNGQTGLVVRTNDNVVAVAFIHIGHGALKNIYIVRNPDKLVRICQSCS